MLTRKNFFDDDLTVLLSTNRVCHEAILNHSYTRGPNDCSQVYKLSFKYLAACCLITKRREERNTTLNVSLLLIFNEYARESDRETQFFFCFWSDIHYIRSLCVSMSVNEPYLPLIPRLDFNGFYLMYFFCWGNTSVVDKLAE